MSAPQYEPPPLEQPPVKKRDATLKWQRQMAHGRGWMIEPDSYYGPESERICRNFQKEQGLQVDGDVGEETWKATWEAPSIDPPDAPDHILERGSEGPEVRQWQQQVYNRGWPLSVDGKFGRETEKICRQFQGVHGLPENGQVDEKTWNQAWLENV
jgi:peptidoglycan hydrolase-like protein with peptidoglycan-binding domain